MRTPHHPIRGITLIDVLISVVVMGIIASVTIPSLMTSNDLNNNTDNKTDQDHNQLHSKAVQKLEHHDDFRYGVSEEPSETGKDLKTVSLPPSDRATLRLDGY